MNANQIEALIPLVLGVYLTMIGFRCISPSKPTADPRHVEEWHRNFGAIARIVGPVLIVVSVITLLASSGFNPFVDDRQSAAIGSGDFNEAVVRPDAPVSFGFNCAWLAVRTDKPSAVVEALGLREAANCGWEKGILAAYSGKVFVTPTVQGWVLAVSTSLPEIMKNGERDDLSPLVQKLSERFGDVQYFGTHHGVEYHGWLRARKGKVVRRYAYLGEAGKVLREDGMPTDDEKRLGLVFNDGTWPDEKSVMKLAGAWSVDPTQLLHLNVAKGVGILGILPNRQD